MTRLAFSTALLSLALFLAACGGFDCNFPDYETVEDTLTLGAAPTPSDTLTVVFDLQEYGDPGSTVWVSVGAETPRVSESGQTKLILRAEFGGYEATRVPPLATETVGDTLFVSPAQVVEALAVAPACEPRAGLVQPVCSPLPARLDVFVLGIEAPANVRVVRYLSRDAYGRLAPMRAAPEASGVRTARA